MGLIGALLGWLRSRGRARSFTVAAMTTVAVVGAAVLAAGVVALAASQPYAVWFPLALGGVLMSIVFGAAARSARRDSMTVELRRISAADRG